MRTDGYGRIAVIATVAVAVATGQHAHDELAACAPDHIFADFADVARALATLIGPAR